MATLGFKYKQRQGENIYILLLKLFQQQYSHTDAKTQMHPLSLPRVTEQMINHITQTNWHFTAISCEFNPPFKRQRLTLSWTLVESKPKLFGNTLHLKQCEADGDQKSKIKWMLHLQNVFYTRPKKRRRWRERKMYLIRNTKTPKTSAIVSWTVMVQCKCNRNTIYKANIYKLIYLLKNPLNQITNSKCWVLKKNHIYDLRLPEYLIK